MSQPGMLQLLLDINTNILGTYILFFSNLCPFYLCLRLKIQEHLVIHLSISPVNVMHALYVYLYKIYIYICLSIYASIYLFIHLCIYLYIYLSTVAEGGQSQEVPKKDGGPKLVGDGCLDPVLHLLKQSKGKPEENWQVSHSSNYNY